MNIEFNIKATVSIVRRKGRDVTELQVGSKKYLFHKVPEEETRAFTAHLAAMLIDHPYWAFKTLMDIQRRVWRHKKKYYDE